MENTNVSWRGNDVSLSVCLNDYGMIYTYDGEDFKGWIADGVDKDGVPNSYAPFWMDNKCIDDYFEDEGEKIADMCGAKVEDMDYEWKMDALIAYYGGYEFIGAMYNPITKAEVVDLVKKDGWNGNMDM